MKVSIRILLLYIYNMYISNFITVLNKMLSRYTSRFSFFFVQLLYYNWLTLISFHKFPRYTSIFFPFEAVKMSSGLIPVPLISFQQAAKIKWTCNSQNHKSSHIYHKDTKVLFHLRRKYRHFLAFFPCCCHHHHLGTKKFKWIKSYEQSSGLNNWKQMRYTMSFYFWEIL